MDIFCRHDPERLHGSVLNVFGLNSLWGSTENALNVSVWGHAPRRPVLLFHPVPALQEDMADNLASTVTLALIRVSFIDGVEVGVEDDLTGAYLCHD